MSSLAQYGGRGERPVGAPKAGWPSRPESYRADERLVKAVNVALLLRRPLLLTGEPGTGKTELAYSVAWELGLDEPLRFDTRSTSESRHLFYTYDALGRFHEARGPDAQAYLDFQALGLAIINTCAQHDLGQLIKPEQYCGPRRSVVLVDEVDKAPRDFPNDLLAALDQMYFTITELAGRKIAVADDELRPIVIVTSNSERALPDAFLRRCVYHHVEFPDEARLRAIVDIRLGMRDPALVDDALRVFRALRESSMNKKPATAEFLDWLRALERLKGEHGGKLTLPLAVATKGVLVKRYDDDATALRVIEQSFAGSAPARKAAAL